MSTIDNELRQTLRELADEGRPVNLGRDALAGARRRRRTHFAVTAAAVAAAAAITLPAVLTGASGSDTVSPAATSPPHPDSGVSVVTSFIEQVNEPPVVLDPASGDYLPADRVFGRGAEYAISHTPDLQRVAAVREGFRLVVVDATGGGARTEIALPRPGNSPAWSPDNSRIALSTSHSRDFPRFDRVVMVELSSGEATEVELDFPARRTGGLALMEVAWLDTQHLLVPTMDTKSSVALPQNRGPDQPLLTGLSVFTTDGEFVREIPLDQSELAASDAPHAGLMWMPHGLVRHGETLLTRHPQPGTIELATLDLTTGARSEPVTATIPAVKLPAELQHDDGSWRQPDTGGGVAQLVMDPAPYEVGSDGLLHRSPAVVAWLSGDRVLLDSGSVGWIAVEHRVPPDHYLVDIASGQLEHVELPVPDYGVPRFGDAAGLSSRAVERAHLM